MTEDTVIKREIKNDNDLLFKEVNVKPMPKKEIGVDLENTLLLNMADAGENNKIDLSTLDSFLQVSNSRDKIYTCLDNMYQDSIVSAIVRSYCEDSTEPNEKGKIVWAESTDGETSQYVNYLLETMQIDKNVYSWVECLAKYGDVYVKLYRQSDIDEFKNLFENTNDDESKEPLNEDLYIKAYKKSDKLVDFIEMEQNPAEIFELRKFGKTQGYIKANCDTTTSYNSTPLAPEYRYKFKKKDVITYDAKSYVHASLDNVSGRIPETVDIFITDDKDDETLIDNAYSYSVKRGQSLFYDAYKAWRELLLMQTSMLLNRVTKSSVTRVIQIEVGDMDKSESDPLLLNYKRLFEQKAAYNVGNAMQEYTNPSPLENTVYIATHEGKGAITTTQIGGDIDVKGISDIDYYRQRFFGAMAVPAQLFGFTEDAAGFSGGQSLSIISSRYGKSVKHLQACICQMITDIINVSLQDKGQDKYINNFKIRMKSPITQEEIDNRDNISNNMQIVNDIMNTVAEIEDLPTKLKILKSLLSNVITDTDVIDILSKYIDDLENAGNEGDAQTENDEGPDFSGGPSLSGGRAGGPEFDFGNPDIEPGESSEFELDSDTNNAIGDNSENPALEEPETDNSTLPNGNDLGMDLTH